MGTIFKPNVKFDKFDRHFVKFHKLHNYTKTMEYSCINCHQTKEGTPWMKIRCQTEPHNLCSYLCYTRVRSQYPRNLSDYIINREDFNFLMPRVHEPQPTFQLLQHEDFLQMSEAEICEYYDRLEEVVIDPIRLEVHEEQEREDKHTRDIEENLDYETDDY